MHFRTLINILTLTLISCAMPAQVRKGPAPYTSPASGKEMFASYCASCHGKDGKGDGPAASALKQKPADLTALAAKYNGKYPADRVSAVLNGKTKLDAHGSQEMPVWGPVFWKMSSGHEAEVQTRVSNLVEYIRSIQAK